MRIAAAALLPRLLPIAESAVGQIAVFDQNCGNSGNDLSIQADVAIVVGRQLSDAREDELSERWILVTPNLSPHTGYGREHGSLE